MHFFDLGATKLCSGTPPRAYARRTRTHMMRWAAGRALAGTGIGIVCVCVCVCVSTRVSQYRYHFEPNQGTTHGVGDVEDEERNPALDPDRPLICLPARRQTGAGSHRSIRNHNNGHSPRIPVRPCSDPSQSPRTNETQGDGDANENRHSRCFEAETDDNGGRQRAISVGTLVLQQPRDEQRTTGKRAPR
jgi:hypothetical protein